MRKDARNLEDGRLEDYNMDTYPWIHERHRIFPQILEPGRYRTILDIAAGMGVAARRIHEGYACKMICNDVSEKSLRNLKRCGMTTLSFDLDDPQLKFPFADDSFDAVISLATLEHILHLDNHMTEIRRILKDDGHLFISTPNYTGIHFVIPYLFKGRSFHNPLGSSLEKYEFYAHVRYFTYITLLEFVSSFGFKAEKVFLPLPKSSSRYRALEKSSALMALSFKAVLSILYRILSPRWAFHPVLCFSKDLNPNGKKIAMPARKII